MALGVVGCRNGGVRPKRGFRRRHGDVGRDQSGCTILSSRPVLVGQPSHSISSSERMSLEGIHHNPQYMAYQHFYRFSSSRSHEIKICSPKRACRANDFGCWRTRGTSGDDVLECVVKSGEGGRKLGGCRRDCGDDDGFIARIGLSNVDDNI